MKSRPEIASGSGRYRPSISDRFDGSARISSFSALSHCVNMITSMVRNWPASVERRVDSVRVAEAEAYEFAWTPLHFALWKPAQAVPTAATARTTDRMNSIQPSRRAEEAPSSGASSAARMAQP